MTKKQDSWIKHEAESLGGVFVDPAEKWKWQEKLGIIIGFIILVIILVKIGV